MDRLTAVGFIEPAPFLRRQLLQVRIALNELLTIAI